MAAFSQFTPVFRSIGSKFRVAEQQLAIGVLGNCVEGVFVGGGLDCCGQQFVSVHLQVTSQRGEPLIGGEVCGPNDVQCHHVVVTAFRLQRLHQGLALCVGFTGQFLQGHLLIGVLLVPLFDHRFDLVGVVFTHRKRDGAVVRVVVSSVR